jgi:hypothetical protein
VLSRPDLASNLPLNRRQHAFFRVEHRAVAMVHRRSARRPSSPNGPGQVTRGGCQVDAASRGHWPWSSCCHGCSRSGRSLGKASRGAGLGAPTAMTAIGLGDACNICANELCLSFMHSMVLWMRLLLLLISSPEVQPSSPVITGALHLKKNAKPLIWLSCNLRAIWCW